MKKFLLYAGLIAASTIAFVSCSDDSDEESKKVQYTSPSSVKIINDPALLNERIIVNTSEVATAKTRSASEAPVPGIPDDALALPDQPTNWNNGVTLTLGKSYYIKSDWTGTISQDWNGTGSIDIYIDSNVKAEFTGFWCNDNTPVNIYIFPGAVLKYCEIGWDNMAKIKNATNVYCWGNITTPENKGFRLYEGGKVHIYGMDEDPFIVNDNDGYVTFQVDTNSDFYCEREMIVEGSAQFNGGKAHFANKLTINKDLYVEYASDATFDDCAYVLGSLDFKATTGAVFNINKYLRTNKLVTNQGKATVNLKDALLQIVEEGMIVDKGDQRVVINGVESEYTSVVKVDGKLYFDRGNDYTTIENSVAAASFPCNVLTGDLDIEGELRIKFYHDVEDELAVLDENNFEVPSTVDLSGNVWLPASEDGCRSEIGNRPAIEVLPPSHKYSATGIAFNSTNPNILYLSWHSNKDTNMDYAEGEHSPSVDNSEDWGGIIDVIKIDSYNISNTLFEQSMINSEHKYNHTMFFGNKLYSPSTSNKIGAALSEIELTSDGKFPSAELFKEIRVNLTGHSANCVTKVGNDLITISGYSDGGINKFDIDDASSQEQNFINDNTTDFQGKYVFYNENIGKVITLNNTDKGIVTIYDEDMNAEKSFETGSIYPVDGKNVCICDDSHIYICKGLNGFDVYDFNGNRIGGSKKSANGVDIDENYIYIATGDGVAILDKDVTYVDAKDGKTYNKTVKRLTYTGKGATSVTDEITVKQSANFVKKGPDGRLYVAYGMYGLQIYELGDL